MAEPTGCGKTAWVLRLIDNVREKIEPVPSRIWYYYGEHQLVFNNYPEVHFEEGLPQLNDEVFDGREPTVIVVDDHMSDVNQLVADILRKSHTTATLVCCTSLKTCLTKTSTLEP